MNLATPQITTPGQRNILALILRPIRELQPHIFVQSATDHAPLEQVFHDMVAGTSIDFKIAVLDPVFQLSLVNRFHVKIRSLDVVLEVPDSGHHPLEVFELISSSIDDGVSNLLESVFGELAGLGESECLVALVADAHVCVGVFEVEAGFAGVGGIWFLWR